MGDASFLKLVEDMILASEKNDIGLMTKIGKQMLEPIKAALAEQNNRSVSDENQKIKSK